MKHLVLLTALACLPAWGQQFTFSPQPNARGLHATIFYTTACAPQAATITVGKVNQLLIAEGLAPIMHDEAVQMIVNHNWRSTRSRVFRYAGYLAAGAAFFLADGAISATPAIKLGVETGAGLLNVLVPAAESNWPTPMDLTQRLMAGPVNVAAGGCSEFVVLTAPTKHAAFAVVK